MQILQNYLPGVEDHHEALGRRADGDGAVVLRVQVVGQGLGVAAAGTIPPPHNLMDHCIGYLFNPYRMLQHNLGMAY